MNVRHADMMMLKLESEDRSRVPLDHDLSYGENLSSCRFRQYIELSPIASNYLVHVSPQNPELEQDLSKYFSITSITGL